MGWHFVYRTSVYKRLPIFSTRLVFYWTSVTLFGYWTSVDKRGEDLSIIIPNKLYPSKRPPLLNCKWGHNGPTWWPSLQGAADVKAICFVFVTSLHEQINTPCLRQLTTIILHVYSIMFKDNDIIVICSQGTSIRWARLARSSCFKEGLDNRIAVIY